MKYLKPALTIEAQVELLLSRGMEGDPALMAERLRVVSYYRLSGYAFPFRGDKDKFLPGTNFETIWRRYVFDRHLRLLVLDAIERIEVALRAQLAHQHTLQHGPFGYAMLRASRPKLKPSEFAEFFTGLLSELARSKESFMKHFYKHYGDEHDVPPFWMAAEVMTFGSLVTFYRSTTHNVKQAVASTFGIPDTVMESWLLALNSVRNICAHHSRLWNRELGVKPMVPMEKEYPEWHAPVKVGNDRIFGILTICKHCMNFVAPQSQWPDRVQELLCTYPEDVPLSNMGFPENWQESSIWRANRIGLR